MKLITLSRKRVTMKTKRNIKPMDLWACISEGEETLEHAEFYKTKKEAIEWRRMLRENKITLHRVRVIPYDYVPQEKWREDVGDPGVHDKDPADLNPEQDDSP